MSPINRANPNGGAGDTEWIPLPAKTFRLEVTKAKYMPSLRADWKPQIAFTLKVAEADKDKLAKYAPQLSEGQAQSEFSNYRAAATLNGFRAAGYQPTKLAEFIAALFGAENQDAVREWIKQGGAWPAADSDEEEEINEGLAWFVGLELYAKIEHQAPDSQGRVWTRAGSPTPIGAIEPDPAYDEFGRNKFAQLLKAAGGQTAAELGIEEGAAVATKYDQRGNTIKQQAEDDEEAELERKLAEARAKKQNGKPAEPVTAGNKKPRAYDEVFGSDDN